MKMTRQCMTSAKCVGDSERFEACNEMPCAVWGPVSWSACSTTCGDGTRTGSRTCNVVTGSAATCVGDSQLTETCKVEDCPAADAWSACSATCGGGEQTRQVGGTTESRTCNDQPCPEWSAWADWQACSATCGGGQRSRDRHCNNGRHGDAGCQGDTIQTESCNTQDCPVWGSWSAFGQCSMTCQGGYKHATRVCIGGVVGDEGCVGDTKKSQKCNTHLCPVWSAWAQTSPCSVTCGNGGQTTHKRQCNNGNVGDSGCEGSDVKYESCSGATPCPYWAQWSAYTSCSVTCGTGTKTRTRICNYGTAGVGGCAGSNRLSTSCSLTACPVTSGACGALTDNARANCNIYKNYCDVYRDYMSTHCSKTCCEQKAPVTEAPVVNCYDTAGSAVCFNYRYYCKHGSVSKQCQKTCNIC